MTKDYGFIASFDKILLDDMLAFARKIRLTHHKCEVDHFLDVCEKRNNDHKNVMLEIGSGKQVYFTECVKSDDLVVEAGHVATIKLILGTSTNRWQFMGYATNGSATDLDDTALLDGAPPARLDMAAFGWREFGPGSLRFAAIGGETLATITIKEIGVFADLTGGDMLNRNAFLVNTVTHSNPASAIILASVVEFVPMMILT